MDAGPQRPNSKMYLENRRPGHNKFYLLEITFAIDHWLVVCRWGRIGKTQECKVYRFRSDYEAYLFANELLQKRLKHGYSVVQEVPTWLER